MAMKRRVLITGTSGLIGGILRDALADGYDLGGVDVRPISGFDSLVADMTDLEAIQPAFDGVDTVIDLAAIPREDTPWKDVHANNIPSTYNALEASRRAGVRRVIFASSNHVTGMYEGDHPYSAIVTGDCDGLDPAAIPYITTGMPIRPDGPYGIAKAFGEAVGRHYSDRYGLSVRLPADRDTEPGEPAAGTPTLRHPPDPSRPDAPGRAVHRGAGRPPLRHLLRRLQQQVAFSGTSPTESALDTCPRPTLRHGADHTSGGAHGA